MDAREIDKKISIIEERGKEKLFSLEKCVICPRECAVNRLRGKTGYCNATKAVSLYTYFLHRGEEPTVSGKNGSGTLFFSGCNLQCAYCQNYKFSQARPLAGKTITEEALAGVMIDLQKRGAHNINLVTPTHFLAQIMKALLISFKDGLRIPVIYNSSGYEKPETISRLNGIIDVYLFDLKYSQPSTAKKYSQAPDYFEFASESITEACRQHNAGRIDRGIQTKGVIIRHLCLPGHTEETEFILRWIQNNAPQALLSLMFQYRPYFKAYLYPEIDHPVTEHEYGKIKALLNSLDISGWIQGLKTKEALSGKHFKPSA